MKTKKLTPRNVAPVKRNTTSKTSAHLGGDVVAHAWVGLPSGLDFLGLPFAGDDAE
ncbi:MAG: anacyclamide/piricyclamide family prenylated cyclic peptide [Cyanobacteria bacterium J06632_19]